MTANQVIVYSDKTVLKISGVQIRGLNTSELEEILTKRLNSFVRVIGVTGSHVDMDVYGLAPEQLLRDEEGILRAVATTEGITATELMELSCARQTVAVDIDNIPSNEKVKCARERWVFR